MEDKCLLCTWPSFEKLAWCVGRLKYFIFSRGALLLKSCFMSRGSFHVFFTLSCAVLNWKIGSFHSFFTNSCALKNIILNCCTWPFFEKLACVGRLWYFSRGALLLKVVLSARDLFMSFLLCHVRCRMEKLDLFSCFLPSRALLKNRAERFFPSFKNGLLDHPLKN